MSAARRGRRTEGERGGAKFGTGRTSSGRAVPPARGVDPASDDDAEEGGLYICGGSSDNLEAMKKALLRAEVVLDQLLAPNRVVLPRSRSERCH